MLGLLKQTLQGQESIHKALFVKVDLKKSPGAERAVRRGDQPANFSIPKKEAGSQGERWPGSGGPSLHCVSLGVEGT